MLKLLEYMRISDGRRVNGNLTITKRMDSVNARVRSDMVHTQCKLR